MHSPQECKNTSVLKDTVLKYHIGGIKQKSTNADNAEVDLSVMAYILGEFSAMHDNFSR